MENITEHMRDKARLLMTNNIKVFLKDIYDNYHFCFVKEVYRDWIIIEHFKGTRTGERIRMFIIDIKLLEEYQERRE